MIEKIKTILNSKKPIFLNNIREIDKEIERYSNYRQIITLDDNKTIFCKIQNSTIKAFVIRKILTSDGLENKQWNIFRLEKYSTKFEGNVFMFDTQELNIIKDFFRHLKKIDFKGLIEFEIN